MHSKVCFFILAFATPYLSLAMEQSDGHFIAYEADLHCGFVRKLLEAEYKKGMLEDSVDTVLKNLENTKSKKTIVKTINSQPIGIISYRYGDPRICGFNLKWLFGRQGAISLLVVDSNERKGHVTELLDFAITDLKPKVHTIFFTTLDVEAEKLYKEVGFQIVCAHPKSREYKICGNQ